MTTLDTNIDTNISHYNINELMAIINIEDLNAEEIVRKTNTLIRKFKITNPTLSIFFQKIQNKLLFYPARTDNINNSDEEDEQNEENEEEERPNIENFQNMQDKNKDKKDKKDKKDTNDKNNQVNTWYRNEYIKQDDPSQTDKITNRQNTTKTFANQHVPMKREQIATTDTFDLPVKQDSLNPNLKNTINRFVNLDSQFRQYTNGIESTSTDYTLDLSDTLKNVLALRLYSYQIPQSWYAIDKFYGNTCFWIVNNDHSIPVSIPSGNYSQVAFKDQLIISFTEAGFIFPVIPVQYNVNSGILSLYLYDGTFNGIIDDQSVSFTITEETLIVFYDFTGILQCNNNCFSKTNRYVNNSLGWIMGYRLPYINVEINGNPAPAILDLNGTKYLILVIDDYNQNHVNNSVVSISQFSNTLKVPSYYSPDIPRTCISAQQGNNLQELIAGITAKSVVDFQTSNPLNGLLIGAKYEEEYTKVEQVLPSAPRTLTQPQIYTINEIKKNRLNNTNYLTKAPTTADILAILPVKTSVGIPTGSLLVEFSGSLQDNSRVYFGPVDIDRLSVKLLDDKGNILNLNGNDWCVTFICECLYQY